MKKRLVFGIIMLLIVLGISSCKKTETTEGPDRFLMCTESGKHTPEECAGCPQLYDQIDTDLKNANYCETDSDCQTLALGGPYIEFGCYHYINKKFSGEEFRSRMMAYLEQCGSMVDECAFAPNAVCVSGKCVEAGVPVVKLEIHDNCYPKSLVVNDYGTVMFTEYGKTNQDKISTKEIESLKQFITENGFFSLNEEYRDDTCMDCGAVNLTVTIGDKTHSVYCVDNCPEQLYKIEEKIKSLWPYEIEFCGFA